ncbi:hypothetical protein ACMATS_37490 [Streptoverticillium reticulum]|uniref:hypothetical protein n=1 Tax=Streptoverticillium reticulum TaxID=1433415 RepID=UPI0039BF861B
MAYIPSTLFAPLYLTGVTSYFEQGLDVELHRAHAGQDAIPPVGTGSNSAVVAGVSAGLFNGPAQGLNVKDAPSMPASAGEQSSPTSLEVAQQLLDFRGLDESTGLRGRKIATVGGANAADCYQLAAILRESGLPLKEIMVTTVPIPDAVSVLPDIDATLAPASSTTAVEEHGVAKPLVTRPCGTTITGAVFGTAFAEQAVAESNLLRGQAVKQ